MMKLKRLFVLFSVACMTCSAVYAAEFSKVVRVVDGDTVRLQTGESVRLLGINTPEIGYKGRRSEAGAEEAKAYLKKLVLNHRILLEQDVEKEDKYTRKLAHVFLENGEHINAQMLRQGMAALSIHPPNVKYVDRLKVAQRHAEKKRLGIWAMNAYKLKPIGSITRSRSKKWGRFSAKVNQVTQSKKGAKLWLGSDAYIWVGSAHQRYFPPLNIYEGKKIEIRGWPKKWGKYWSIRAIHPSQLILK